MGGFGKAVVDDVVWAKRLRRGAVRSCSCSTGERVHKDCERCYVFPTYQVVGRCVGLGVDPSDWELVDYE